jgi:hypothetical protein
MLQEPQLSDKHHGLLAIGTLGNNNLKEDPERSNNVDERNSSSSQDHLQEFTSEELGKLQKELNLLLDIDESNSSKDIVLNSGKDVCLENKKGGDIGKKSLSFVLKKMFVCRSTAGLAPARSLRDPLTESRMEKVININTIYTCMFM